MSKDKLIPELRFPEFVNDGEWNEEPLDDICKLVRGPFGGALKKEIFVSEGFAVYEQSHAIYSDFSSFRYRINDEKFSELKRFTVKAGDLIMSCSGTMGKFAMIPEDFEKGVINQALLKLTAKKGYDKLFVKISLETDENQKKLLSQSAGGAIKNVVSVSQIRELSLAVPNPEEQQKIASCLSSLDELLAAHNDKLDALKDHKKGLMQNLFPNSLNHDSKGLKDDHDFDAGIKSRNQANQKNQGSDNVPKVRFKEFEGDGEWMENTLDNVAKFSKGKGISKSDISENGKLPCIRYGELYTHYNETISVVRSHTDLMPSDLVLSKANDVIIPASGETQIDIATASCVLDNGIALGGDLNIIRTKINGVFLSYYLNNAKKRDIAKMAQGISVVHLYSSQLKTLTLRIPNPKEQQKIASCLSAVDELITAQADKIEQLQQHKKGLMQGLFPKIER